MILGSPAFRYIKDCCEKEKIKFLSVNNGKDGYWHILNLFGQQIDILYTCHPSYSRYYDRERGVSQLIPELMKFFA